MASASISSSGTITGVQRLVYLFGKKARIVSGINRIKVGYTADYAIYVHEDLTKIHPNGQAKFLEQPARTLRSVMRSIVLSEMRSGKTLEQALLAAAERLKVESQTLCPVDTGALKASAVASVEP